MSRRVKLIIASVCALALLVAGGWYTLLRPDDALVISADFTDADGIYAGNPVDILGVAVGTVRSVDPRGAVVRVSVALPADTRIPASAQAYIMSPEVISDRFVELDPAYTSGPVLAPGAVIPQSRTHVPLRWNQLESSLDSLLTALGPNGLNNNGDLSSALHAAATGLGNAGPALNQAITNIDSASTLLAGDGGDIATVLDNLDKLATTLAGQQSTIDSLSSDLTKAGQEFSGQQANIADTIGQLATVMSQVDTLIKNNGATLTGDLGNIANLATLIAAHQSDLSEIINELPLVFDNFARAVSPDQRLRIRLDISTNLSQFSATAALCAKFTIPLCEGAGITNPIAFPPDADPLSQLGGGK